MNLFLDLEKTFHVLCVLWVCGASLLLSRGVRSVYNLRVLVRLSQSVVDRIGGNLVHYFADFLNLLIGR